MVQNSVADVEAAVGIKGAVTLDQISGVIAEMRSHFSDAYNRQKGTRPAPLTDIVRATLYGKGFEIEPALSVDQSLSHDEPTSWAWQIKAIEAGDPLVLTLRLYAMQRTSDYGIAEAQVPLTQPIFVSVAPDVWWKGFVSLLRDVRWILLGLLVPAFWAAVHIWKRLHPSQRSRSGLPQQGMKPREPAINGTKMGNGAKTTSERSKRRGTVAVVDYPGGTFICRFENEDITFKMSPDTELRDSKNRKLTTSALAVGASVLVTFRMEGKASIADRITIQAPN
jgi:hypothetical protein